MLWPHNISLIGQEGKRDFFRGRERKCHDKFDCIDSAMHIAAHKQAPSTRWNLCSNNNNNMPDKLARSYFLNNTLHGAKPIPCSSAGDCEHKKSGFRSGPIHSAPRYSVPMSTSWGFPFPAQMVWRTAHAETEKWNCSGERAAFEILSCEATVVMHSEYGLYAFHGGGKRVIIIYSLGLVIRATC